MNANDHAKTTKPESRIFTINYLDGMALGIGASREAFSVRSECQVEVFIDWDSIARVMGARACTSKTGKCVDGFVTVKRVGQPKEMSRVSV